MSPLSVVVFDVLADHLAQVPRPKGNNVTQALLPNRADEALGVCVKV
jgi:hypothetical protein